MTMSRTQIVGVFLVAALLVVMVALLLIRGDDDGATDGSADDQASSATTMPPVVADDAWCAGWQQLVQIQGQFVADPSPQSSAALLAAVDSLQALGVPESLDPAGYTELTAVLDDVRASADPSFTPSVEPSEPADVAIDGHDDEPEDEHGDEHGEEGHGAGPAEAPFGTWLATYCSV